jgi:hypothetical protein
VQDCHLRIDLNSRVIIDRAGCSEYTAVSVIGVLVEADVGHDQAFVANLLTYRPDCGGQDARRIQRAGAARVLVHRDAEQHDACQSGVRGLHCCFAQRVEGVLNHPGHGADRAWLSQPFSDKHGQDQLARLKAGLGHHRPHSCGRPEPPRPLSH